MKEDTESNIDGVEILPANSDYWVKKNGNSIQIGRRGSKEIALTLQGQIGNVIYDRMSVQKRVEARPILHLHDDDLAVYEWVDEELVQVKSKPTRRFARGTTVMSDGSTVEVGFDNPLIFERQQIYDRNCHRTARDVAKEAYWVATRKGNTRPPLSADIDIPKEITGLSFPVVIRLYECYDVFEFDRHSLVVIGRDDQTNDLICFEKVGGGTEAGGLPYRIMPLNKILTSWRNLLEDKMRLTFAGSNET